MAAKNAENANCRGTACRAPEITFVTFVRFVVSLYFASLRSAPYF
jgi:hypothetical protein